MNKSNQRDIKLDKVNLRRSDIESRRAAEAEEIVRRMKEQGKVSAGVIDKVTDFAFNPSREKIREVTIIDRMQGRTFPLIDTMGSLFLDRIKISAYRQSPGTYEELFEEEHPPVVFDIMGEFLYRTAQWQKSVAGKNLERATDIALAEIEKESGEGEEEQYGGGDRGYRD